MIFIQAIVCVLISLTVTGECYILRQNQTSRISKIEKGDPICIKNAPYHVIIKVQDSYKCGGALIEPNWVLTAAHCVRSTLIRKSNLIVVAGKDSTELNPGNSLPDGSIEIASEHIVMHPLYARRLGNTIRPLGITEVNDLALIKLAEKFPETERIKPISLPKQNVEVNEELTMTGTGRINSETKSSCLRFYKPRIVDCSLYDSSLPRFNDIFCHKDEFENKKTHVGDSGGPLVNNRNELVGIHTCTSGNHLFQKANNVYYYLNWIHRTINAYLSNDI